VGLIAFQQLAGTTQLEPSIPHPPKLGPTPKAKFVISRSSVQS